MYQEKDIVLGIGTKLSNILLPRGHGVIMTREKDAFVPLEDRSGKANRARAHLFVSIHCNADPDPDEPGMHEASGAEILIAPNSKRGRKLAEHIGDALTAVMPDEPWRGVKERGLLVLVDTDMPAVLIETAFIDNSKSVRRLSDPNVQQAVAAAIYLGIKTYGLAGS